MKKSIIIIFLIFYAFAAGAQDQKIKFGSVNQVGLLSGNKGEAGMLQTINGIKKDKWFAGMGIGLDFYRERTVPLFIDFRRDFTSKKNTPFAYADAGLDFGWLTAAQKQQKQKPLLTTPGLFYDFGIGWKLSGKNKKGFILSGGYTFKQVEEKVTDFQWIVFPETPIEPQSYQRYNYLYRRIVIKVGFML